MSTTYKLQARLSGSSFKRLDDDSIEHMIKFSCAPDQDEQVVKNILCDAYGMTAEKIEELWSPENPIDKYHSNVKTITNKIKFAGTDIANCSHLGSFLYKETVDKEGDIKRAFDFCVYKSPHESDASFTEAHLNYKELVEEVPALDTMLGLPKNPAKVKMKKKYVYTDLEITI